MINCLEQIRKGPGNLKQFFAIPVKVSND